MRFEFYFLDLLVKILLKSIIYSFALINLTLGFYGLSSILLTFTFYVFVWYFILYLTQICLKNEMTKINIKIFVSCLFVLLFLIELTLKYGLKTYCSYNELNGSFFYSSPYKQQQLNHLQHLIKSTNYNPQLKIHEPNSVYLLSKKEYQYEHRYNKLGLRDREPISDTCLNTIIALGDSFTEGEGTPSDSTWPALLQKKLLSESCSKEIQCINAGCSGSDPFFEYLLLKKKLLGFKPKIVLLSINQSDIYDVVMRGGFDRFTSSGKIKSKERPWWEFLYQFSFIVRHIVHDIFKINRQLMSDKTYKDEVKLALDKLQQCILSDFKRLAIENKFDLFVILHPMQYELEKNSFNLDSLFNSIKHDNFISTINLKEEINFLKSKLQFQYNELYWQNDMHHNSKGYNLWATIMAKKIAMTKTLTGQ